MNDLMHHNNTRMIGHNIRPGMRPGGFTTFFSGASKPDSARRGRPKVVNSEVIKEAANAVLEGRGAIQQPDAFSATQAAPTPPEAAQ